MNLGIIAAIAYGVLALFGGLMAYAKVKSKASLISGSISGGLLLVAALMQLRGFTQMGMILAQVITAALIVVFTIRLLKTRKFMPAGLMLVAGLATLGIISSS